jgi:hypothetical protein
VAARGSRSLSVPGVPPLSARAPRGVSSAASAAAQPGVGATQRVDAGTTTLAVRLLRVIDPLRDSGARLPPGAHAVGVVVQIRDIGQGGYDSSATGDIGLLASGGPAAAVFAPRGVCQTALRDFDNEIGPGEVRQGCVVFALPAGQRAVGVRFSPHAGASGRVSWRLSG